MADEVVLMNPDDERREPSGMSELYYHTIHSDCPQHIHRVGAATCVACGKPIPPIRSGAICYSGDTVARHRPAR